MGLAQGSGQGCPDLLGGQTRDPDKLLRVSVAGDDLDLAGLDRQMGGEQATDSLVGLTILGRG